jgi:TolB-like protein
MRASCFVVRMKHEVIDDELTALLEQVGERLAAFRTVEGVAYVVDGSVRKSGARLRVVARLIHAEDEYVVWSETYDRPLGDILSVQDEIAGEVAKTLRGIHLLGQNGT